MIFIEMPLTKKHSFRKETTLSKGKELQVKGKNSNLMTLYSLKVATR